MSGVKQDRLVASLEKSPEDSYPVSRILQKHSDEPAVRTTLAGVCHDRLIELIYSLVEFIVRHMPGFTVLEPLSESLTRKAVLDNRINRLKCLRRFPERSNILSYNIGNHYPLISPYLSYLFAHLENCCLCLRQDSEIIEECM